MRIWLDDEYIYPRFAAAALAWLALYFPMGSKEDFVQLFGLRLSLHTPVTCSHPPVFDSLSLFRRDLPEKELTFLSRLPLIIFVLKCFDGTKKTKLENFHHFVFVVCGLSPPCKKWGTTCRHEFPSYYQPKWIRLAKIKDKLVFFRWEWTHCNPCRNNNKRNWSAYFGESNKQTKQDWTNICAGHWNSTAAQAKVLLNRMWDSVMWQL